MKNEILNIDCMEGLRKLPDNSVDLVIADIPYHGITEESWDNQWETLDDYVRWLRELFREFSQVLKTGGACYVWSCISHYPVVQLALNDYLDYAATITWKKQRGRGNGWGFNREEICVNTKGKHEFKKVESQTLMLPHLRKGRLDYSNGGRRERKRDYKLASSIWDDIPQVCSYRKQFHPTEKPVECTRRMLEASSNPDDLVLVPFVGSGSELEACIRLERNYIGMEISEKYCEVARDRVANL